jgi:hypothetical protein
MLAEPPNPQVWSRSKMFPLKRACIALAGIALAACGNDRSVNPIAEIADGSVAAITSGGTLVAQYSLLVGQSVKINPKTTTRTNRLRWSTSNSNVASVSSRGTVTARASGSATVQVSGTGVLENYAITVTAPAAPTVTRFSLQPKTGVSLTSGQSQQFAASATWSDGMQYPITVSYTATGGTISGTGLFTAGNLAGTFMVVATCACTSPAIADTALVSVVVPQLTSLTVSPKTASVAAGATQQFGVTASWSTGATTVPPVTWTATGGTVSTTGLYTAPATAGTYRVIVAHTNGTVRDTATVTVSGTSVPTSTSTPFFSDSFDNGQRNNASGFSWGSQTYASVSNERSYSGGYALKFQFAAAPLGQDGWSEQRFNLGRNVTELWVEYYMFLPTNFVVRNDQPANNKFIALWADNYSTEGDLQVITEFEYRDSANAGARMLSLSENYPTSTIRDKGYHLSNFLTTSMAGKWHRVRVHFRASSASQNKDGIYEGWIGDTLAWRSVDWSFWYPGGKNYIRNGYLMGWANSGYAQSTDFFIDDVKFFTTNPGW